MVLFDLGSLDASNNLKLVETLADRINLLPKTVFPESISLQCANCGGVALFNRVQMYMSKIA